MIDLHLHTNCSDGTDSPIELLKKAKEKKLEYISITDHDNCNAYEQLQDINLSEIFNRKINPRYRNKMFIYEKNHRSIRI